VTLMVVALLSACPGSDIPAWSPDGGKIAFISLRAGRQQAYMMNPDGSDQVRLTSDSVGVYQPVWRP